MPFIERHIDVAAPPPVLWSILDDLRGWPRWDPDLVAVEQIVGGLTAGGTFEMVLPGGLRGHTTLSDVRESRALTWRLRALGGLLGAEGHILLEPLEEGSRTRVTYRFAMRGPVGRMVGVVKRNAVIEGTEGCLTGLQRLAEADEPRATVDESIHGFA